jgi:hypothetical protein
MVFVEGLRDLGLVINPVAKDFLLGVVHQLLVFVRFFLTRSPVDPITQSLKGNLE